MHDGEGRCQADLLWGAVMKTPQAMSDKATIEIKSQENLMLKARQTLQPKATQLENENGVTEL